MPLLTYTSLGLPSLSGSRGSGQEAEGKTDGLQQPFGFCSVFISERCVPRGPSLSPPFLENTSLASLRPRAPPRLRAPASLLAQSPFHNKASRMAQQTFVPGQNPVFLTERRTLRSDTLIFSLQEGWCQLSRCLSRTRGLFSLSLVAAVFPSPPVSISA